MLFLLLEVGSSEGGELAGEGVGGILIGSVMIAIELESKKAVWEEFEARRQARERERDGLGTRLLSGCPSHRTKKNIQNSTWVFFGGLLC